MQELFRITVNPPDLEGHKGWKEQVVKKVADLLDVHVSFNDLASRSAVIPQRLLNNLGIPHGGELQVETDDGHVTKVSGVKRQPASFLSS